MNYNYSLILSYLCDIFNPSDTKINHTRSQVFFTNIGNDCVKYITHFLDNDKDILNFISTNKDFYLLKNEILFCNYYPIFLNKNLSYKSRSTILTGNYQEELPEYIDQIEISKCFPVKMYNVKNIIINVERSMTQHKNKINLTFYDNLEKIYFKKCDHEVTYINFENTSKLKFLGFNISLVKDNFKYLNKSIKLDNYTIDFPQTNYGCENYKNINFLKSNLVNYLDNIEKLYLNLDLVDIYIDEINNFIRVFNNLKELVIDGKYCENVRYDWLESQERLYVPEGVKVCKIRPAILLKEYPKSLKKLFLRHLIPCNEKYHFEIIKINPLDKLI